MRFDLALLGVALVALVYAAANGDVTVFWVLIVPIVAVQGVAGIVFFLALMGAGLAWFARTTTRITTTHEPEAHDAAPATRRSSGVVFLGPIPITWGVGPTGRRLAWLIGLGIAAGLLAWWAVAR